MINYSHKRMNIDRPETATENNEQEPCILDCEEDFVLLPYPGRLVIVEGIDGSGKSTQIRLLKTWLEANGYPVVFTEWNSSSLVKTWTKRAKKQKRLTPTTFSLIHASDFYDRYERIIIPLLRAGHIVLADRYIYTAFARDTARGCDREWVRNTYRDVIRSSLALYFQTPLDVAVERILAGRPKLKYHEAGLDIGLSDDPVESFKIYQGIIKQEYDHMIESNGLTVIDGTQNIDIQQKQVRQLMSEVLADYQYPTEIARSHYFTGFAPDPTQSASQGELRFKPHDYPGKLIVIEGSDYSGHSNQSQLLTEWLETQGHAVYQAGIKRSKLMSQAIEDAKEEQVIGSQTMGLFYATDFADELENGILPALRAGFFVVADRYVYTLMARQLVRSAEASWLDHLFHFAVQPDATLYLSVPEHELARRCLQSYGKLFYRESGLDLAISPDPLTSLLEYQAGLLNQYRHLCERSAIDILDGTMPVDDVQGVIRERVKKLL
jgi:dTMP kinase